MWHLPEFMGPTWAGSSGGSGSLDIRQIGKFVIFAMTVAIIIAWVFNNTKGSLLMATLMHASIGTFSVPLRWRFAPADVFNSLLLSFGLLALLLIALTRGRLGYQHYRQEEPNPTTAPT